MALLSRLHPYDKVTSQMLFRFFRMHLHNLHHNVATDNLLPKFLGIFRSVRHERVPLPRLPRSARPVHLRRGVIAQQRSPSRRVVRDLASWLEACNTYISVLVAHYPAQALKLLAYQLNICDASLRFPADC